MQKVALALKGRPQLGQQVFARGMPEAFAITTRTSWDVSLYDMLKAYGDIQRRKDASHYDIPTFELMSMDDAMGRVSRMLGQLPRKGLHSAWTTLESFLPENIKDKLFGRSSLASMLTAALEMAKQGALEMKQDGLFRPIYMRSFHGERSAPVEPAGEGAES